MLGVSALRCSPPLEFCPYLVCTALASRALDACYCCDGNAFSFSYVLTRCDMCIDV